MKRYILPELPYDYAALEPHYSARLLRRLEAAIYAMRKTVLAGSTLALIVFDVAMQDRRERTRGVNG
jgi:hypothetical protein